MIKIMVTGHRPDKIGGYDKDNPIRDYISQKLRFILKRYQSIDTVLGISGMALGSDQDFCHTCLELGIPYHAYIPFAGQENMWPETSKQEYQKLVDQASKVIIVSPGQYSPQKMQIRNKAMANNCNVAIAIWNGDKRGGTYNCIEYLRSLKPKKLMIFINPNDYRETIDLYS